MRIESEKTNKHKFDIMAFGRVIKGEENKISNYSFS